MCLHVLGCSLVLNSASSWIAACQAPLSVGLPGKNTGVGCHLLLQGILPTQGSNPHFLHWQVDSLPLSHLGHPSSITYISLNSQVCLQKFYKTASHEYINYLRYIYVLRKASKLVSAILIIQANLAFFVKISQKFPLKFQVQCYGDYFFNLL